MQFKQYDLQVPPSSGPASLFTFSFSSSFTFVLYTGIPQHKQSHFLFEFLKHLIATASTFPALYSLLVLILLLLLETMLGFFLCTLITILFVLGQIT